MGTRHLTCVYHEGKYKLANYGQWDGYPDGQGLTALKFCRDVIADPAKRAQFIAKLDACREVTEEQIKAACERAGARKSPDGGYWMTGEQSKRYHAELQNGVLSRDNGAGILQIIFDREPGTLIRNEVEFAADSLFCEWAWVIDLDTGAFEGFKGFNTAPLDPKERFAFLPRDKKPDGTDSEYYPVRLAQSWRLSELPTDEEFLAAFKEEEEDAA